MNFKLESHWESHFKWFLRCTETSPAQLEGGKSLLQVYLWHATVGTAHGLRGQCERGE